MTSQVPLYQVKAELFRMLGHPIRIRILELLCEGPRPVRELLAETGAEASNLSQHLAMLRKAGIVTSTRELSGVVCALATPEVAEMMTAARRLLTRRLTGQGELLAELRAKGR